MNTSPEEALFFRLLAVPAHERAAWLARECAGRPELQRQVEALLAAHEDSGNPLATRVDATPAPALPSLDEFRIGEHVGRYRVLERLGEGGCGVVYVAEQTEPVRRRVALKVIKLGMDTRSVIARFEAERQALALMDHPHIARILDGGATERGRPYFVMELVRGTRITDFCDQNESSTRERIDLFIKVCQAVQHAHQKGIIHRDIKPSNILVTLHDGVPVPKVIDFGIARATEGRLTEGTVYTQLHQFIGTPAYMSPEQAEMSGLDIDTRTDIYSLGVLLYELLAGRPPFESRELMSAGIDAMRRMIREQEPARPSTRILTLEGEERSTTAKRRSTEPLRLHRQIKGDLDWIVMKCLEKDRRRRYESSSGLAADLRRHLDDEPVQARPPSAAYRIGKAFQRNRLLFGAGAAVVMALLVGIAVSVWQARVARIAKADAEAKARQAIAAREESESVVKFLTEIFRSPSPEADGRTVTVIAALDRAAARLKSETNAFPAKIRARLLGAVAQTYAVLGTFAEARALADYAADQLGRALGENDEAALNARGTAAGVWQATGDSATATERARGLVRDAEARLGPEHPTTIGYMEFLAGCLADGNGTAENVVLRERLLAIQRRLKGPHHADTLGAMLNLANTYELAGRGSEVLKMRTQVLESARVHLGEEHKITLASKNNVAASLERLGRVSEALPMREELLATRKKVDGLDHPETLGSAMNLAILYGHAKRFEDASALMRGILEPARHRFGAGNPQLVNLLDVAREIFRHAGHVDESLRAGEEALDSARKAWGPDHQAVVSLKNNLAVSYMNADRRADAIRLLEEILPRLDVLFGPKHPNTVSAVYLLAAVLLSRDLDPAARDPRRALELSARLVDAEPTKLGFAKVRGIALFRAGDPAAAVPVLERVLVMREGNAAEEGMVSDAEVGAILAQARWATGDGAGARAELEKARAKLRGDRSDAKAVRQVLEEADRLMTGQPPRPREPGSASPAP